MKKISGVLEKYNLFHITYSGAEKNECIPAYTRCVLDTNIMWDMDHVPRYRLVIANGISKHKVKVVGVSTVPGETVKVLFENPTYHDVTVELGKKILSLAFL